jgi:hypothetical protein
MAFKESSGIGDHGQVAFVDVTPDPPPPDPILPPPPEDASPVQQAQSATIEQTGADPPPEGVRKPPRLPATPRSSATPPLLPPSTSCSRLLGHLWPSAEIRQGGA